MKISRFSQDKMITVINDKSFYPGSHMHCFFRLESKPSTLIKFYIFGSKVSPPKFSSIKANFTWGKYFVTTQLRLG